MKHKTWFRLVIKAIGVLLIGLSLRDIAQLIVGIIYQTIQSGSLRLYSPTGVPIQGMNAIETFISTVFYSTPEMIQFAFGLYLFYGGKAIINRVIPSNRPYCPECGYDLSHANANAEKCTECGVTLPRRDAAATDS